MKKHLIIFAVILVFTSFAFTINAQEFDLDVGAAILIDAETGQVLYEKNADEQLPPASITKIMTLLIAMEQVESGEISMEDEVTISRFAESMGGSQIFLQAGTRVKFGDLLKAVTIASGNDASVAVAETVAGTYGNFVNWMNERAKELGMENTHFENTTGLPEEYGKHYSTARDISIMSRELVKYTQILQWASIWHELLQLPGREADLTNTNKLIRYYPGMDGLKTGHTQEAGYCLSATAVRDDMRLISVVMAADTEREREEATSRLLDYGFNAFNKELRISQGDEVQNIEVPNGKQTVTTAYAAEDLYVVIKKGTRDTISKKVNIEEELKAPIEEGQKIGEVLILQEGKILGRVDILASENIEKAGFFTRIWRSFVNWVGGLIEGLLG
ncbi:MAG: D-alanyl-D-alanine carboxypeptidase family protein [Halanaerobiales bacterium]